MNQFKGQFTTIKGLSEVRRLPRLGKIRLGVKAISKKSGKEYPKETPYFVVPPEVERVYGAQPTTLDIMFPLNDIEVIFPQAYKWYGQSRGLKCIGNGVTARRVQEDGVSVEIECPCEHLKTDTNPKGECTRRASLMVMLPKINLAGIYQIDTGSYHSIVDVQSSLAMILGMMEIYAGYSRFAMIPLKLVRVPRETHGSGSKETHYTLQIRADISQEDLEKIKNDMRMASLRPIKEIYKLPPVEEINPEFDPGATVVYTDEEDEKANGNGAVEPKGPPAQEPPAPSVKTEGPPPSPPKQKGAMMPFGECLNQIEKLLKINEINRMIFIQYLQDTGRLSAEESSLSRLKPEDAAHIAETWHACMARYQAWQDMRARKG